MWKKVKSTFPYVFFFYGQRYSLCTNKDCCEQKQCDVTDLDLPGALLAPGDGFVWQGGWTFGVGTRTDEFL